MKSPRDLAIRGAAHTVASRSLVIADPAAARCAPPRPRNTVRVMNTGARTTIEVPKVDAPAPPVPDLDEVDEVVADDAPTE